MDEWLKLVIPSIPWLITTMATAFASYYKLAAKNDLLAQSVAILTVEVQELRKMKHDKAGDSMRFESQDDKIEDLRERVTSLERDRHHS